MKIVIVQKANKILTIPDVQLNEYIAKGFSQVDESGKVIQEGMPIDAGELRVAYVKHQKEIEDLKAKIEELENELAKAKKAKKASKASE